jgi:hypothetical protein
MPPHERLAPSARNAVGWRHHNHAPARSVVSLDSSRAHVCAGLSVVKRKPKTKRERGRGNVPASVPASKRSPATKPAAQSPGQPGALKTRLRRPDPGRAPVARPMREDEVQEWSKNPKAFLAAQVTAWNNAVDYWDGFAKYRTPTSAITSIIAADAAGC